MSSVALSSDGQWIATTAFEGGIRIWNRETGQLRAELDAGVGVDVAAVSCRYSRLAEARRRCYGLA